MTTLVVVVVLAALALRRSSREREEENVPSEFWQNAPPPLRAISFASNFMLRRDAADALEKAVAESDVPRITSAWRSNAEQVRLYELYKSGKGNLAAKPGTSLHETGLALDARGSPTWERAMVANGWLRPLMMLGPNYEPWHWEYRA